MKTIIENQNIQHRNSRTTVGAIILIIGSLLLIRQLNLIFIPKWIFSWPMILIAIGTYASIKHSFRKPIAAIMIILGITFLCTENIENSARLIWPIIVITAGTWMVFKHKKAPADNFNNNKESGFKEL